MSYGNQSLDYYMFKYYKYLGKYEQLLNEQNGGIKTPVNVNQLEKVNSPVKPSTTEVKASVKPSELPSRSNISPAKFVDVPNTINSPRSVKSEKIEVPIKPIKLSSESSVSSASELDFNVKPRVLKSSIRSLPQNINEKFQESLNNYNNSVKQ